VSAEDRLLSWQAGSSQLDLLAMRWESNPARLMNNTIASPAASTDCDAEGFSRIPKEILR
jgi:hypothetical protein